MKKSFILASTLFLATLVQADYYVGLNYLTGSGTHTAEKNNNSIDVDVDSSGYGLKLGFGSDISRVELTYTSMDVEYKSSTDTFYGIDIDWVKPFDVHPLAKPFISLGLGWHQWKDYEVLGAGEIRDRGAVALNIGVGALYKIQMFELEAGYKYKYYLWEDLTDYLNDYSDSTSLGNFYAGVNYHF